jgi:hypothetical protein
MAPLKQLPPTEEAALKEGHQLLSVLWRIRRKGRPKKKGNLASDKIVVVSKSARNKPVSERVSERKRHVPPGPGQGEVAKKAKMSRTNWGIGENLLKITRAKEEWISKTGGYLDRNGEARSLTAFAFEAGIPYSTFKKYVSEDQSKRREVGKSVGNPSKITRDIQNVIVDTLSRYDRANNGKSPEEAIDLVCGLAPSLNRKQCSQILHRTIIPGNPEKLKPNAMKAQATTTKRSAITVAQQFRWHTMYEAGLNQLRERNTGVCNLTGKTFGELIRHFIVGGDETCMHASAGHTYVIGSTGRKKHEKILHDSRCSITMYRTGSVAGDTGPTIFLMAGERIRSNFNDAMLKRNGAQEGSTIIMTPTAFVTEEAWTKMTPSLVRGLRSMPIVIDNPQWWMLEIFDGFGPHLSSLAAMEIRHDNKILAMKEEGDSSHVNQAYDKFVAKSDKAHKRESLGMLRNAKNVCKGVIDQYGLLHASLYTIRATTKETWTRSFQACNLDPLARLSFPEWCKKIGSFLQTGQTFKCETALDKYSLLPSFWHGFTPDDKRLVVKVIDGHGGFTVQCCKDLLSRCHVAFSDQQSLRPCYEVAKEHPHHLNLGVPTTDQVESAQEIPELGEAFASMNHVTKGLASFQLKPDGLTGENLFNHMLKFGTRDPKNSKKNDGVRKPSAWLDVEVTEDQLAILKPQPLDRMLMEAMQDAGGQGATMKLAKRKLDMFGNVNSHSGMANDEKKLNLLRNKLQLAASIAEVSRMDKADAQSKKNAEREVKKKLAPAASAKLAEKQGDVSKLTKAEIVAILYDEYGDDVCQTKHKKHELVKRLDGKINRNQLAAEDPVLEEESGEREQTAGVESGDEGAGHVFEQSYDDC